MRKNVNFASMQGLSILIPVFRDSCVAQVKTLSCQCQRLDMLWEIVVADDGSPSPCNAVNDEIGSMPCCRLIKRTENVGRAAIRNFLACEARFDTLLYIDAGMMPSEGFVDAYVKNMGKASVVCGSIGVDEGCVDLHNLRCLNELKARKHYSVEKSNEHPYKNFHSGNFMVCRQVVLDNPFREDIKTYGYEDTLFGKGLADRHISIVHIDIPLLFVRFESNRRFLEKTEEAMLTLYAYRQELKGYSALLYLVDCLQSYHLLWITVWINRLTSIAVRRRLMGDKPSLFLYNIFRVYCLSTNYRNSNNKHQWKK